MKVQVWIFLAGFLAVSLQKGFPQADTGLSGAMPPDPPYLIPQTLFVGDPGRLVVPLGPVSRDFHPFIVEKALLKPLHEPRDLVIQRIELENRGGQARLLVDFVPYAPGFLTLPDLPLPDLQSRGLSTAGLQVWIASLLTQETLVLSEPLPPLAIPGTTLLIYGSTAGILTILLGGIGFRVWGRGHLQDVQERIRRRRLIRVMKRLPGNLEKALKNESPGDILCRLSGELRHGLSLLTGMPCQAMDAGELKTLPPLLPPEPERPEAVTRILSGIFLCGIFRRCDALRFSGTPINRQELLRMLKELQDFTHTLDQADKKLNRLALLPWLKQKGRV
ncbi:MAG: hypothetical protein LBG24_11975 [Treponema sp.]|jgi:hypothetical protein|nr:hypothetical protein [Treponema sp.]